MAMSRVPHVKRCSRKAAIDTGNKHMGCVPMNGRDRNRLWDISACGL